MSNQSCELLSHCIQIGGETVLAPAFLQGCELGFTPALALAFAIILRQFPQHAFRTAQSLVILAGRQFMAAFSGVKTELLPRIS
jgi:hypothetical protein